SLDQQVPVDQAGRVPVTVNDNGAGNDNYTGAIIDIKTGSTVGSGILVLQNPSGSPHIFSGNVSAGSVPGSVPLSHNKTASVLGFQGSLRQFSDAHDFYAYSKGSGAPAFANTAAQVAQVADQPVPTALHLSFDGPGGERSLAGDLQPQPVLLLH